MANKDVDLTANALVTGARRKKPLARGFTRRPLAWAFAQRSIEPFDRRRPGLRVAAGQVAEDGALLGMNICIEGLTGEIPVEDRPPGRAPRTPARPSVRPP